MTAIANTKDKTLKAPAPSNPSPNPGDGHRFPRKTRRWAALGYLILMLGAGFAWFQLTNVVGTICGALMGAMLANASMSSRLPKDVAMRRAVTSSTIVESMESFARYGTLIGLYFLRHETLPDDVEFSAAQEVIGPVALALFFITIAAAAEWIWGAKEEAAESDQVVTDKQKCADNTQANEARPWSKKNEAMAWAGGLLATISMVFMYAPSVLSTPEMAVNRFAVRTVLDFAGKQELAYHLVGMREYSFSNIRKEGQLLKAEVRVETPVLAYAPKHKNANTRAARKEFFDAKYAKKRDGSENKEGNIPFVMITSEVTFEPSGIAGWRVIDDGGLAKRIEQAQQDYEAKTAKVIDKHNNPLRNPFGMRETWTDGLMSVLLVLMVMSSVFIMVVSTDGRLAWTVVASGVLCVVINHQIATMLV